MKSPRTAMRTAAICFLVFALMSIPVNGKTLPGVVSYWPAEGDALDSVGSNNGNLFGGAAFGPGTAGQAFDLTGSGDRVFMDRPFPTMNIGDEYTVSLWMKMITPPVDWGALLSTRSADPYGFNLGVNSDGGPWIAGNCDDNANSFYCSGPATTLGDWQYVAAVFNWTSGKIEFYVNGDLASTCPLTDCSGFTYSDKIFLGASFDAFPGWEFNGFLDEIQIYGRALSSAEISWLYEGGVASAHSQSLREKIGLSEAYPNPFNPQTTIAFDLPKQTAVSLQVFDVSGRLVKVLVDGEIVAKGHNETNWNGRDDTGRRVASGTYFYRLEAGEYSETKRMALIK